MSRVSLAAALFIFIAFSASADNPPVGPQFKGQVRETKPLTPSEERDTLHAPDGFRVQVFASEGEIQKPLNMAFDEKGRLWLSCTVDYPFPAEGNKGADTIKILEDTTGDGKADKITTFAEKISMPMGLLPYKDGVIAFCIPNIYFFRDTTGDGKADRRTKLYGPFDFSRDTHGLNNSFRRGFDGWIYACHGFNNQTTVAGSDGHSITMNSGNTYRFRPDGSRIERVGKGQVNPFGMTFDAWGDLFNSDCHTQPVSLILKGGSYPSFGKPHDGLGFVPPVMDHTHGSTAIAGVMQYTGDAFPPEYHNDLFVGNVMTGRVHRDKIKVNGSSIRVVEQRDFLIADDPWFRPVDIQSGPDGALYIADFYNRIIGHYEVPLDHPDRDRKRGRIWRVSYVGEKGDKKSTPVTDLSSANVDDLIAACGSPSFTIRMNALNQLSDRVLAEKNAERIKPVAKAAAEHANPLTQIQCLWALFRVDAIETHLVEKASLHEEAIVRCHAMQIAGAMKFDDAIRSVILAGLADDSPRVRRAAAMAAGEYPDALLTSRLLEIHETTSKDDAHLRHAIKIAVRNQLQHKTVWKQLNIRDASNLAKQLLVEAALGVPKKEIGEFLVFLLSHSELESELTQKAFTHASSRLAEQDIDELVKLASKRLETDPDAQLRLLQAIRKGLKQNGFAENESVKQWAGSLTKQLLALADPVKTQWRVRPGGTTPAPWGIEKRNCADGAEWVPFLSSLPGGEAATSKLRSRTFEIPAELSFFICGHLGWPKDPPTKKNLVRICLENGKELARAYAPRNDLAQQVKWQLGDHAGKRGYIEIVDGIDLRAYAWLAVSRFKPAVVTIEQNDTSAISRRIIGASELATTYHFDQHCTRLSKLAYDDRVDLAARAAAAKAVATFVDDPVGKVLADVIQAENVSDDLRERVAKLVGSGNRTRHESLLKEIMQVSPAALQSQVAGGLASESTGAKLLLKLVAQGDASPRLLQESTIRERLLAADLVAIKTRLAKLTASLPPPDVARTKLIARRLQSFDQAAASATNGRELFVKHCKACHAAAGSGGNVGPQLDGVGLRGAARLLEDIVDPHRNVDIAFFSHTYRLDDGRVLTGLFRRQEGDTTVIADPKGKEVSFSKTAIEEQKKTRNSIMPDNWGTVLPENDLHDLLAFLLAQRAAASNVKWETTQLDERFRSEGAAVADVNGDGKLDVLAGQFWYEAPDWSPHELAPPGDFGDGSRGYSNSFANFADDINGDGLPDLIVVGFPGAPCHWFEHPGNDKLKDHWKRHEIWHSACNETTLYTDLFKTGKRVLVMAWQPPGVANRGQMAWFEPGEDPKKTWKMHPISERSTEEREVPFTRRFSHGLGHGDMNGDGRTDVICPGGWWEQPGKVGDAPWKFHAASLGAASSNMFAVDMNGDDHPDGLSSSAHGFGIWAHHQLKGDKFETKTLFKDLVSQTHALQMADINGDGVLDFVTGKRFWAHGPKGDVGADQPAMLYWFEGKRNTDGAIDFDPHAIHDDSGIGTQFEIVDLNDDGKLDVVTSNKKGVFVHAQQAK